MRLFTIAIGLGVVAGWCGPVAAGDGDGDPTAVRPLQASLRKEDTRFDVPCYTAMVSSGLNKFAFRVPQGYSLRGDPGSGRLTLVDREGDCSITFTIIGVGSDEPMALTGDMFRESVLRGNTSAKIVDESMRSAACGSGPAFDIQWKISNTFLECKRVVYISTRAGVLEFTATTGKNHFDELKPALDLVLQTFHYSTDGVLKVPPVPDES